MSQTFVASAASWRLVERAQAGDMDAYAEIYRQCHGVIAGWIYQRTRNVDLTQDLTADVFERALRRIDSVTWQGRDFLAFLHTIARNRLADHIRSAAFRHTDTVDDLSVVDRVDDVTAEDAVVDRAVRAGLVDAVRKLPPDQRQCVVLRVFNDLSIRDTAELMGRTEGAIKSLLYRATHTLAANEHLAALAGAA